MALGGFEWVLIALAVLMLFGAKRIPEFARGIGQGINEFRRTKNDIKDELNREQEKVTNSLKFEPEVGDMEAANHQKND